MADLNTATAFLMNWQQAQPFAMQPGVLSNVATEVVGRIPQLNAELGGRLAATTLGELGARRRQEIASEWAFKTAKLPYDRRPKSTLADKLVAVRALQQGLTSGRDGRRQQAAAMLANAGGLISADPLTQARGVQNTLLNSQADIEATSASLDATINQALNGVASIRAPYSAEVPMPTPPQVELPSSGVAAATPVSNSSIPLAQPTQVPASSADSVAWLDSRRRQLGLTQGVAGGAG